MKKRVIILLLAFVVCTSFMVVPASAAYDTSGWGWNFGGSPRGDCFPIGYEDGSSVALINNCIDTDPYGDLISVVVGVVDTIYGLGSLLQDTVNVSEYSAPVGWRAIDALVDRFGIGFCSEEWLLDKYIPALDAFYNNNVGQLSYPVDYPLPSYSTYPLYRYLGFNKPEFSLREDSNGFLRVYDSANGWWVVDSWGQYCFSVDIEDTTYSGSIYTYVPIDEVSTGLSHGSRSISVVSQGSLSTILNNHKSYNGISGQIFAFDSDWQYIGYQGPQKRYVLCDAVGNPIMAMIDSSKSVTGDGNRGEDANYISKDADGNIIDADGKIIIDKDGNILDADGNIVGKTDNPDETGAQTGIAGNTSIFNINSGNVTFHDASKATISGCTYDTVDNVYNIQLVSTAQAAYESSAYSNIEFQFNVDSTNITYIGTQPEDNVYFTVYYKLPDGRSSADLTKEELEQLNVSMDVVPYIRSADDTRLRCLYHFDGYPWVDSSYWNYCTDLTFTEGATINSLLVDTDENFGGAMYLDERPHEFTITLPSNVTAGDFTLVYRYYSSYTECITPDSYVKVGADTLLQWDGRMYYDPAGTQICMMPIGSWSEVALIRYNGVIYMYLDGICRSSIPNTDSLSDKITFYFGDTQQTYKELDELRFYNVAAAPAGRDYTCAGAPVDTNLSLVLPDQTVPIADEYWSCTNNDQTNLLSQYGLDWWDDQHGDTGLLSGNFNLIDRGPTSCTSYAYSKGVYVDGVKNNFGSYGSVTLGSNSSGSYSKSFPAFPSLNTYDNVLSYNTSSSGTSFTQLSSYSSFYPVACNNNTAFLICPFIRFGSFSSDMQSLSSGLSEGTYTFSMVDADGNVGSYTFDLSVSNPLNLGTLGKSDTSTLSYYFSYSDDFQFNGYIISFFVNRTHFESNIPNYTAYCGLMIYPTADAGEFVYLELVEGSETSLNAEFVSGIAGIDSADLNTPTLAVRSEIAVNNWQIGGVRPLLPARGQVYALVEGGYITSLQQYNGSAWVEVDGRIWTGKRWIPYNYYNVITLSDMFDITDASGKRGYEYIYTDSGFWDWFQNQWLDFKNWYSNLSFTGGGSTTITEETTTNIENSEYNEYSDNVTVYEVVIDSEKSTWNIITGIFDIVGNVFKETPEAMDGLKNAFEAPDLESEDSASSAWYVFDAPYEFMSPYEEGG